MRHGRGSALTRAATTETSRRRGFAAATIVLAFAATATHAAPALASAGPPIDYAANPGLSQPAFDDIEKTVVKLPAYDGRLLYLEVTKPKGANDLPVILEASPYHGTIADREGTRILPEPRDEAGKSIGLTGFFAPRGYAVVMMDLRGTGRSQGCLDHLGPKDGRDLERVVEWAATQPWSNGRVGMTGHQYAGAAAPVAAAQNPEGLVTIVPSAGFASMYDHQFQGGVPYQLHWAGPIQAYEQLAIERKLPAFEDPTFNLHTGDDQGNSMEETGCGLPQSAAVAGEDQLSGRYSDWHLARDHRDGATDFQGSVFAVHGVNDNAARVPGLDWFLDRDARDGDKLWLGQWDHGASCCPNRRGFQWPMALLAWFDHELKGTDVDTGPNVEAFLADNVTFGQARSGGRSHILTAVGYPRTPAETVTFFPAADGNLGTAAPVDGAKSFQGTPQGFSDTSAATGAIFLSQALESDMVLLGMPVMNLAASVTVPRVHLIATLYDQRPDGNRRRITQCAINPELRDGLATRTLVVPATRYEMAPPCMQMAHRVPAGHRLALRISTADPDKVPLFAVDPSVTVFTGGASGSSITLPVAPAPAVYADEFDLEPPIAID